MKRLLKIFSLTLFLAFPIAVTLLVLYPHRAEIVLYKNSLNAQSISRNTTLNLLSQIAPPSAQLYLDQSQEGGTLEHIDDDELAKHFNQGEVRGALEPEQTTVVVSSANIMAQVRDGSDAYTMMEGPWHFPLSDLPGSEGNFVLIGHRYAELPPSKNTFFHLDKVKVGDKVEIKKFGDTVYSYTVTQTRVVDKNDRSVLVDHGDYRITLITCTPLWTSNQRLVVVGVLDKIYRKI